MVKSFFRKLLHQKYLRKLFAGMFSVLREAFYYEKYKMYQNKYSIDPTFSFNGEGILFYGDGEIHCGKNSYIGRYGSVQVTNGSKVVIGDDVAIGHFVMIYTSTKVARKGFYKEADIKKGNVVINNKCWIGAGVFIKEGITIGENSVIGANAVVTKDIPPNCVAGGIPARVLYYKEDVVDGQNTAAQ